ncbi:MAG: L-histidine N(alpha)-methyltransferase [Rickettsiales bacterium]|nr:L-histidine N(alpha)-methyltransferase [Rickettsiales bacterium]
MSKCNKELGDYIDFFGSSHGCDMVFYAYKGTAGAYNEMVQSDKYYLCREEIENIKQGKAVLENFLYEVSNIIEIGPGSEYTLLHKTIPILSASENLTKYIGFDYSESYLEETLSFLKANSKGIGISGIVGDLLHDKINIKDKVSGQNCVIFLGSTIGNFTKNDMRLAIDKISDICGNGDKLIITFDINQDEKTLLSAYNNKLMERWMQGILKYFIQYDPSIQGKLEQFKLKADWDGSKAQMFFEVQEDLSVSIPEYGAVELKKGRQLRGVTAHKFTVDSIAQLLGVGGFQISDILTISGRMATVLAIKNT